MKKDHIIVIASSLLDVEQNPGFQIGIKVFVLHHDWFTARNEVNRFRLSFDHPDVLELHILTRIEDCWTVSVASCQLYMRGIGWKH